MIATARCCSTVEKSWKIKLQFEATAFIIGIFSVTPLCNYISVVDLLGDVYEADPKFASVVNYEFVEFTFLCLGKQTKPEKRSITDVLND